MFDFIGDLLRATICGPFICIGWLIVGAAAGALARTIAGGGGNLITNMVLGLIGAIVGGILASIFRIDLPGGGIALVIANLVIATIGAVVVIFGWRTISGGSRNVTSA